jgi:hypothetical protein
VVRYEEHLQARVLATPPPSKGSAPWRGRFLTGRKSLVAEREHRHSTHTPILDPLTYAQNAINRGMGELDLYPFVLTPEIEASSRSIDTMIR